MILKGAVILHHIDVEMSKIFATCGGGGYPPPPHNHPPGTLPPGLNPLGVDTYEHVLAKIYSLCSQTVHKHS